MLKYVFLIVESVLETYFTTTRTPPAPPPQWEKSNKYVPLGQIKKIIFENQIKFVCLLPCQYNKKM
jgi:hypothetical protein